MRCHGAGSTDDDIEEAWLERYRLRDDSNRFHRRLNARWTVCFARISGVEIAVTSDDMVCWMDHGLDVHHRINLQWLSSSRRTESLQRRRGGASSRIHRR